MGSDVVGCFGLQRLLLATAGREWRWDGQHLPSVGVRSPARISELRSTLHVRTRLPVLPNEGMGDIHAGFALQPLGAFASCAYSIFLSPPTQEANAATVSHAD